MKIYHVSELTRTIKSLLEENLPSVWVEGEISEYSCPRSGHHYFSLKDEDSILPCVMWKGQASALFFTPQAGMKVIVQGRVTVFEKGGRYQFEAWSLQLTGEGELLAAFERMKAKLAGEGLFSPEHKKPIPKFPWRIGLVTSPTGAAIRDMVAISQRRNPAVQLILYPVQVQGVGAAEEIAEGIKAFNRYGQVELLIVGRGGGSLEDLWPFNEEIVARSIFDSRIPVISAVGHEIDYTIADLAADLRAPTPSAAIELALPEANELLKNLSEARLRIKNNLETRIKNLRQRLQWVLKSGAIAYPERLIKEYYQRLDENRRRVEMAVSSAVDSRKSRLQALMGALKALDPLAVLKRGYSICRKLPENLVVTDAEMLNKGDKVNLTFHRGYAFSRVEKAEVDSLKL